MPTTTAEPKNLALFVGDPKHDTKIVMRRIFVCCICTVSDKSTSACLSLEEIPLMRQVYKRLAGRVSIVGPGQVEEITRRMRCQDLTEYQWQGVLRNLMRTYSKVQVGNTHINVMDEVYGSGPQCSLIPKMHAMAEEWNGSYDPKVIESLLAKHFPHINLTSKRDIIDLPGRELGVPEIGRLAPQDASPALDGGPDDPPMAESPTIDPALVQFLMRAENTDGDPLDEGQARAVSFLATSKPTEDWTAADMRSIPAMNGRNRNRLIDLVTRYFNSLRPPGFVSDGPVVQPIEAADPT
jgi:hypothetical protein